MASGKPTNDEIANVLERIAKLLEVQDANPHRIRAYRRGASTVRNTEQSLAQLVVAGDVDALEALPNIGQGLAGTIAEFVRSGRVSLLERLQGEVSPEMLFAKVPGIGHELAERIATQLDIDTLEGLEQAAHDGRLQSVDGFGPRRVEAVRTSLAGMLSRSAQRRSRRRAAEEAPTGEQRHAPPVALLLAVDAEYRRRAEADKLKKIAPRRFNPDNEAWLPIMHRDREGWSFTALYSNTARAHELGTTRDWVVIYYERNGREDQCTVVTETSGPLKGKRVIRGREAESRRYYEERER